MFGSSEKKQALKKEAERRKKEKEKAKKIGVHIVFVYLMLIARIFLRELLFSIGLSPKLMGMLYQQCHFPLTAHKFLTFLTIFFLLCREC